MSRNLVWTALAIVATLLASTLTSARAQDYMDTEGQPSLMRQGSLASYWIWHDREGYHVRVTTAHDRRTFTGRITFSRELGWVRAYQLGAEDEVRATNDGIRFRIVSEKGLNGFNFRTGRDNQATLHLEINDMEQQKLLQSVFLGQNNVHPMSNDFTLSGGPMRRDDDRQY